MKFKIDTQKNQIIFWLNSKTYPLEAIYSAAYLFFDRAYIHLDGEPEKEIEVSLKGKTKLSEKELEALAGEFQNELLNYLLRVEIAKRNRKIREFIVGSALVSAVPRELIIPFTLTEEKSSLNEELSKGGKQKSKKNKRKR
jgi:His-Xaa-Ser system protein HxsD